MFIESAYEGTIPSNTAVTIVAASSTIRAAIRAGIIRNAGNAALTITLTQATQTIGEFLLQPGDQLVLEQPLIIPSTGTLTATLSAVPSSPWTYHFYAAKVT